MYRRHGPGYLLPLDFRGTSINSLYDNKHKMLKLKLNIFSATVQDIYDRLWNSSDRTR